MAQDTVSFEWTGGVSVDATAAFLVHSRELVWRVETGALDLFLVALENDEAAGARRHILRLNAGEWLFALPKPSDLSGVVAASTTGTTITAFTLETLREQAQQAPGREALAAARTQWVRKLSEAAVGHAPEPQNVMQVDAGAEGAVEADTVLVPGAELAWVVHRTGSSQFLGRTAIDPGAPFPLARGAWLTTTAESEVSILETEPDFNGIDELHRVALECIVDNIRREDLAEADRAANRGANDQTLTAKALFQLSSPLSPDADGAMDEDLGGDVYFKAAQAVCRPLGIKLEKPPDTPRGKTFGDPIHAIARGSGVRTRQVLLKGDWWRSDNGPLLAMLDEDQTPIALTPLRRSRGYRAFNPSTGETASVHRKFADTLTGIAYSFYRPFPAKALNVWDLMRFGAHGAKRDVFTIIMMGVGGGLLGLATPIATGFIFDRMIPAAQRDQLMQMTIFLIAIAVAGAMFSLVRGFAVIRLESRMDASVQAAVWDRLLSLPVPFFRDYTAGDLAQRGLGISAIRRALTGSALTSVMTGVFSVFSFALMFYYSWKLALLGTAVIAVAFVVATATGILQVRRQRALAEIAGRISGMVLQFIGGVSKFRVSGAENRAFARWASDFSRQRVQAVRAGEIQNFLEVFYSAWPIVGAGSIFLMIGWLMRQPGETALTTGEFLAFNAAYSQFLGSAFELGAVIIGILDIVPLYERAAPIMKTLPEVDAGKADPGELTGEVEVNHLAFRYREDTPLVLRDVSLKIEPGQFVAFVGPSGCGKSTLFRLLLGFEKPASGALFYDGQDLSGLDIQTVRQQIGVVLQNGNLMSGDIFTNIIGSAALTIDDAWEAARMAGFAEDVEQMPMGMHTVVSEGGGGLSGGQRQRLMIARAIVNRPRILLFDEATSALDNRTQQIVSESLERLHATRIVIAHRLSTIVNADRIFVLHGGVVAQQGTYQELIDQPGIFADLARRQIV